MCTLTFIPKSANNFILTSNRDEAPGRKTFSPKIYKEEGVHLLYPKDAVANGTWIGVSDRSRAVSLMNGGFIPHKRKPNYRKSRGLVVKDFLIAEDLKTTLPRYEFTDIEPFTAVVVEWLKEIELFTLVWDGEKLHIIKEPIVPKIWSSSPLYPGDVKLKREQWFNGFLKQNENISKKEILNFHKTGGEENFDIDLIMDRGFVKTKSITQIAKIDNQIIMDYEDLQSKEASTIDFSTSK